MGLSMRDVAVPEQQDAAADDWAAFRAAGRASGEFTVMRKDGACVPTEFSATADVLPGLHLSILRDITERRASEAALAEASRRSTEILESIDDGFYALDAEWRFTYVNARASTFLKREADDLIGQVVWDEFPDAVGSTFETHYRRAVETGRAETFDAYYPAPLDAYYAVRAFPFRDGVSVYFHDVTEERAAEAALRESERQFAQLADAMPQLVWTSNPAGDIDYVNERWYAYTGMAQPAEPGGKVGEIDWNDLMHPDDLDETFARWAHSIETGEPYELEYRYRRAADGEYRWFIGRAVPVRDATGAVVRWFGTGTDIHDLRGVQEEVRTSEERLQLVSRATNDAVWDWDVTTGAAVMNEAFTEGFGWQAAPTGGFTIGWMLERVHPDERARVTASALAAFKGGGQDWRAEYRFERADGTWADVVTQGYIVRSPDGWAVRVVGTMLDLTARKAMEQALVEAKEAAEEVARIKSSILMNMSHEIRTPLTAVIGYAEMLAEEAPPDLMDLVVPIKRGGKRLLDTLNSVLDLAQIEAGALPLVTVAVDLRAEADAAVAALEPLAHVKGLDLTLTGSPATALADRAALARVLTNLVGNAIKFTERGTVAVDVWTEDGSAWLRVTDSGVGIDPAFLPHVFDDFKQESSGAGRSHEGSGLGLTITHGLVTMMDGEISAASEKGAGSTFTIRLPAAERHQDRAGQPVPGERRLDTTRPSPNMG